MLMLADCSNCRTPLQLPPGATYISCAACHAITRVSYPLSLPPPPPHQLHGTSSFNQNHYVPAPSPYNHAPAGQPPSAHGSKRAVICGILHRNTENELHGSINDTKWMKFMLVNRFKFPESSILLLTEEETDPDRLPTKHNIRKAMRWLVQGCKPGDSLVFHFSGHGSQKRNWSGDEIDGFDETLCPLDFKNGGIVDDEINATIVNPLPTGVKLHAIIDACHSGTMLDLPYLCRMDSTGGYFWDDHRPSSGIWKGTNGGEVISFSGCDDHQTSAETSDLSKVNSTGAMTYSFIEAIESGSVNTYGDMINRMRSTIRKYESGVGGGGAVSPKSMLLTGGRLAGEMRQEPQLTSNEPFDVYGKHFSL